MDANTDCSEDDIVTCALARVEQNAIQFQDFVSILRGTTGMDDVVIKLEEKKKYYKSLTNVSMYMYKTHTIHILNTHLNDIQ